jgi:hypothetical protein
VVAEAARSHGVRLIAPSRPGYGVSTMSPPGLARTADDTLELADQLGIGRFALLGSSGGGPFALAMAAAVPDRVSAIAVLASPGNYAEVKPEVLGDDDRRALDLAAAGPFGDALEVMNTVADADLQGLRGLSAEEFSGAIAKMGPPGGGWLNRHPELLQLFEDDFRRAITTSDGMSRDNLSWLREWDFDPASVSSGCSSCTASPIGWRRWPMVSGSATTSPIASCVSSLETMERSPSAPRSHSSQHSLRARSRDRKSEWSGGARSSAMRGRLQAAMTQARASVAGPVPSESPGAVTALLPDEGVSVAVTRAGRGFRVAVAAA